MELRHLRYYVAVAEELSFLRASERLHVSHAPVNRQVREMERQIGVKLIRRGLHGVELTPAGRLFLDEAREILRSVANAVESVRSFDRGETGHLRIGQGYGHIDKALPSAIGTFQARFPSVDVQIIPMRSRQQYGDMIAGEIDIAFFSIPDFEYEADVMFEQIAKYRMGLLVGHSVEPAWAIDLHDFAEVDFLILNKDSAPEYYQWAREVFGELDFEPQRTRELDNIQSVITLAAAGVGAALVPECIIPENLKSQFHPIKPIVFGNYYLAYPRKSESITLQNFLDIVREHIRHGGQSTVETSAYGGERDPRNSSR